LHPLALFLSARGRLAPTPFARATIAVYLAAFLSQFLVSAPVMAHAGPAPFALVQALAIWSWFCLHAKRLRDSGTGIGGAIAIAILYGLAVLLFMLTAMLIAAALWKDATTAPRADLADLFGLFLFIGMVMGERNLDLFAYVVMAILILILIPIILALGFSVFAFGRPSATPALP
jgi:hypothetical protein